MGKIADLLADRAADFERLFEDSKSDYVNGDGDLEMRASTLRSAEQIARTMENEQKPDLESAVVEAAIKYVKGIDEFKFQTDPREAYVENFDEFHKSVRALLAEREGHG